VIQRLQRNAVLACLTMAVTASAIARSLWWGVAVLGGGLLIGISFIAMASGVHAIAADRPPAFLLLKVIGRYALLGFLAYVMIARLRLPPLGLIAGASSFAVAALVELVNNRRN
jgi:threonine/homoserine/homoserine lactone efflux protein